MPFLAPLALLGLLFVPLIVAFYMLRLRRPQRTVSSTFLWQQLVRDVEANAPWQRLRRSLLLLLQLLAVIALALVVARPFGERPAGLARDLVVVIDTSASMSTTDVFPDRLTAGKRAAVEALNDLPSDGKVSVVAAGESARLVANEVTDRGRARRAIESVGATTGRGDLSDGLKVAAELASRAGGAEILVVTDDALASAPNVRPGVPVRVITVGRERRNQSIVALAVRADPSGLKRSVFVSVANFDATRVTRRLQVIADGVPVSARDIVLEPLIRADVVIDELPPGTIVAEAILSAPEGADPALVGGPDALALDDHAWAVVPPDRLQRILLVGPGNVYLQNALALLPNVELYGATIEEYGGVTGKDLFDLIVFDGVLPDDLPEKPVLAIAPPETSPLGVVTGTLTDPAVGEPPVDEPLLRNVDLTRLHVASAQHMELPAWAREVIGGPGDAPLLYSGVRGRLPTSVIAFDLRQSDLPLQVAWPILAANLVGELLGLDPAHTDPVSPGSPVELPLAEGATGVRVTLPDGSAAELAPPTTGAASVTFVQTEQLGIYRVEQIRDPEAVPTGTPTPPPTPSPAASGASAADDQPEAFLFAVDLFDADESNITPGDGARLTALGDATGTTAEPGRARDEWWAPLVLVVLGLLLAEWLVYERDGARRQIRDTLRRGLTSLLPRRRGA